MSGKEAEAESGSGDSESREVKAKIGTFKLLTDIANGCLGNAYTKRLVKIVWLEDQSSSVGVLARIQEARGSLFYDVYSFSIDDQERVTDFRARRLKTGTSPQEETIKTPPFNRVLREISVASKIQLKLKR